MHVHTEKLLGERYYWNGLVFVISSLTKCIFAACIFRIFVFFNQVSIPESCVHENALATSPVWHDWTTHPSSPWFQMSLMCASYYQYDYFLVNSIRNVVYRCPFGQTWCTSVSIDEDMGRTSAMSLQSTYMMSKVDCYFEIRRYVTNKLPSGRVILFLFSKYNYSEIVVFERMTITNPIYVIQNVNEWVCVFS